MSTTREDREDRDEEFLRKRQDLELKILEAQLQGALLDNERIAGEIKVQRHLNPLAFLPRSHK